MSFWDTQGTAAPAPAKSGGFWDGMDAPAKETPYSAYFQGKGYGASNLKDTSGKPLLTYENEKLQASQLLSDRVATTFDPTVPQKLNRSVLTNGRMPEDVSTKVKSLLGGTSSEELDHAIALELSGSNQPSNLQIEPLEPGSSNTATDPLENKLARQVINGDMSLVDAQRQLAKAKGITLSEDEQPQQKSGILQNIKEVGANAYKDLYDLGKSTIVGIPEAIKHPVNTFKQTLNDVSNLTTKTISDLQSSASQVVSDFKTGRPAPEKVADFLKLLTAAGNTAFSPVSGIFTAVKNVPIIGQAAQAIGIPFEISGDIGSRLGVHIVNALPISEESKAILREPVAEAGSLASQVVLGGKVMDAAGDVLQGKKPASMEYAERVTNEISDRIKSGEEITREVAKEISSKAEEATQGNIVSQDAADVPNDPGKAFSLVADRPEAGFFNPGAVKEQFDRAYQAYKEQGETSRAAESLRTTFTGLRDEQIAETNQIRDEISRSLKSPIDREATLFYREFQNRPGEISKLLDGTHPYYQEYVDYYKSQHPNAAPEELVKVKEDAVARITRLAKVLDRAANPSEEIKKASEKMSEHFKERLAKGKKAGFLDSSINPNEYMTHLLVKEDQSVRTNASGPKITGKFQFSKERTFPDMAKAIIFDKKPATLNALDAMTIYGERFAVSSAYHEFGKYAEESGIGKFGTKQDAPAGWEPSGFKRTVEFTDENGKARSAQEELYLPKKLADAFKPITQPSALDEVPGHKALRVYQAYLKSIELSFSMFHAKALTLSAIADMGPDNAVRSLAQDLKDPKFLDAERRYVRWGMTTDILGRTVEAYKGLKEGPAPEPSRADIFKELPGVKQADFAAKKITELTFGILQRKYKVGDMAVWEAKWLREHPEATYSELEQAGRLKAKEVNSVYGGLHWENLGVNRMTQRLVRMFMLAPDWTFSNFGTMKYAFQGGPAGAAARMYWIRSAIVGAALTEGMSYFLTHKLSKDPTSVYYGKDKNGKDIYSNIFFAGAPSDMINLVKNVNDFGVIQGVAQTAKSKAAPVARTALGLESNKDYQGNDIAVSGAGPAVNTARTMLYLGQNLAPIPFSVSTPLQMYFSGKDYSTPEYLTSALAGTRIRHTIPAGMETVKSGAHKGELRPATPKTPRSFWDQVISGKLNEPAAKQKKTRLQ